MIMKKITDIKGDYGSHIMTMTNRMVEKIVTDFVHKISGGAEAHIPDIQTINQYNDMQTACKQGINLYICGNSRMVSYFNSYDEYVLESDTWNQWIDNFRSKYKYQDKYIDCVIEYSVKKTEFYKGSAYEYTLISNISYLKVNFKNIAKEIGEPKNHPSYYDVYGKEILEGDEIVWTPEAYVELHVSVVKGFKDNRFIFEEDDDFVDVPNLMPEVSHDNVIVVHRKK